jgi:Uma2 family endonuclease
MQQRIPQAPPRRITEDEYLHLEETARMRHEFRGGQIIDMAGGTEEHSDIAGNLIQALRNRLKGKPCKAYGSDLRVRINESGDYCYPDVTVVCGQPEFARPDSRVAVVNPTLVIEVTSATSEVDDRVDKFSQYRLISSLSEYVLVSSTRMQVESFYKQPDGVWAIGSTLTRIDNAVRLRSLEMDLPLADIYAEVVLPQLPTSKIPAEG